MTAATSQHLADVLRAAGFYDLAMRAEQDEFHDFLTPHATPAMVLAAELATMATTLHSKRERLAAHHIRMRLIDGEFDASHEEGDEWAASPEGRSAFSELVKKPRT